MNHQNDFPEIMSIRQMISIRKAEDTKGEDETGGKTESSQTDKSTTDSPKTKNKSANASVVIKPTKPTKESKGPAKNKIAEKNKAASEKRATEANEMAMNAEAWAKQVEEYKARAKGVPSVSDEEDLNKVLERAQRAYEKAIKEAIKRREYEDNAPIFDAQVGRYGELKPEPQKPRRFVETDKIDRHPPDKDHPEAWETSRKITVSEEKPETEWTQEEKDEYERNMLEWRKSRVGLDQKQIQKEKPEAEWTPFERDVYELSGRRVTPRHKILVPMSDDEKARRKTTYNKIVDRENEEVKKKIAEKKAQDEKKSVLEQKKKDEESKAYVNSIKSTKQLKNEVGRIWRDIVANQAGTGRADAMRRLRLLIDQYEGPSPPGQVGGMKRDYSREKYKDVLSYITNPHDETNSLIQFRDKLGNKIHPTNVIGIPTNVAELIRDGGYTKDTLERLLPGRDPEELEAIYNKFGGDVDIPEGEDIKSYIQNKSINPKTTPQGNPTYSVLDKGVNLDDLLW